MRTTEMGAWMPGSGLTPGMRRPVLRITVPSIPLRKIAFGEPTSSGASGVTVAALRPNPVSFVAAAASCTTLFSVALRFSSERSYLLNSRFNPLTEGSRTLKDSSKSSCPVWSPSMTIIVLRSTLSPRKRSLTHVLRLVYDGLPREAPIDVCLREEVYELQVLELGGESGRELGPISGLAHASRDLQERLHGTGEGHVAAPDGYYRALYLRAVLYLYKREVPRRHGAHHRRPGQERYPEAVLDHPFGRLDVIELYRAELPDAGVPEEGLGELVVARRAVEHDQLLPADLGDRCRALLREAVLRIYHQYELVLVERHALYLRMVDLSREPEMHLLL